jgi:multiple sugar transport system permease protein
MLAPAKISKPQNFSTSLIKRKLEPYGFISPTVFLLLLLMVIPVFLVIRYSFMDNVIVNQNPLFVGLENYRTMIADERLQLKIPHSLQ